jgi:NDP-sugar pyrophosphorylase family protein
MKALILADRFGEELWPLTEKRPISMLPIANKPVLQLAIEELYQLGIRQAAIVCSRHQEQVSTYFGDGSASGMELSCHSVAAPCSVEYGLELAGIAQDDPWIAVRGDILRPFGFLEEAMLRGWKAAKSSIFTAMGIAIPTAFGEPLCDIRWAALQGQETIDPLSLESIAAYHRCNMIAMEDKLPDFIFPGRPTERHIAINQQSVVRAPFLDRRTVIGRHCLIERNVILGPGSVIGDGCIVDNGAAIFESVLLPGSYVGAMEVECSVVDGSRIYCCQSGAITDLSGSSLAGLNVKQPHAEFSMA